MSFTLKIDIIDTTNCIFPKATVIVCVHVFRACLEAAVFPLQLYKKSNFSQWKGMKGFFSEICAICFQLI